MKYYDLDYEPDQEFAKTRSREEKMVGSGNSGLNWYYYNYVRERKIKKELFCTMSEKHE